MRIDYLLIDYENVQPRNLRSLHEHAFRVIVFVGASQAKVPLEFASAMQELGCAGEYVRISGNGRNALDFHIAFVLGQISRTDQNACFHVISNDAGFDPLLTYLRCQGISAERHSDVEDIPCLKPGCSVSAADRLTCIVRNLGSRGNAKPRKRATLSSTINALFQKSLPPVELDQLIEALREAGYITLDGEAVTYDLAHGGRRR